MVLLIVPKNHRKHGTSTSFLGALLRTKQTHPMSSSCKFPGVISRCLPWYLQDFGSGASTRGSKLLPATARGYNEPLVPFHLKNFKGNSQAIEERKVLFLAAPHLCYRVPVVIPLYDKRTALSTWFYFKTHWHIFRDPPLNESRWISSIKARLDVYSTSRLDRTERVSFLSFFAYRRVCQTRHAV